MQHDLCIDFTNVDAMMHMSLNSMKCRWCQEGGITDDDDETVCCSFSGITGHDTAVCSRVSGIVSINQVVVSGVRSDAAACQRHGGMIESIVRVTVGDRVPLCHC